ncbi:Anti-repressor SinI [Bacillus sp. THAF10]|nr:anti-repressor SinI family protein [Bacillus sp. THAF10]QFT90563.1 Anti-repressor SinI [Bacillus sp. THAF10]
MNKELDTEWVELMQIAKAYGISIDEVRAFLQESSPSNKEVLVVK